jgi:ferredoxin
MKAVAVDPAARSYRYLPQRCIGCGQCVLACERQRALSMEPVPCYKLPYKSWFSLLANSVPGMLRTTWRVWRSRKAAGNDAG